MPPGDFVLFKNIGLDDVATGVQTSTINEPSVFNNGQQIYVTGNWFASKSVDNGSSWQYVSPFTTLPSAAGGFCCDQLALYDPSRDLSFWLLQYRRGANRENIFRIAIKRGATLGNNSWYWYDFAPSDVNNGWAGLWFDYPDMALSDNQLWITFNVFNSDDRWQRAVVFRFPLDELASGASLDYDYWSSTSYGSLRLVQGAEDTMYWASHNSNSQIRLFSWPETSNNVSWWDINVNRWTGGNGYSAPGPDGNNWLARTDRRITGGWLARGILGFMWSVDRSGNRPLPHIRVVRINELSKAVVDQPDIWSNNAAFAYPAACPNDRGHVGVTMFFGGGSYNPSHVVGIWDDFSNGWELVFSRQGTNGPPRGFWGDYINCRRHSPDGLTWIASGYTLQGGTQQRNIEPQYVHFGRRRNQPAVNRLSNI
ncbi:MAG: hypothetical protein AB4038_04630 [Prochloraceae cyanobacterium]